MHPKKNRPSEYVKTSGPTPKFRDNPIAQHLQTTGLDLDDLASSAGLDAKTMKLYFNGKTPSLSHLYLLDLAFNVPQGTFKGEYGL